MAYQLRNRVHKLERMAASRVDERRLPIIRVLKSYTDVAHFPEPYEEWVTFRQAQAENGGRPPQIFIADPIAEVRARRGLQNETKGNDSRADRCRG